jgi:hypothetical protein
MLTYLALFVADAAGDRVYLPPARARILHRSDNLNSALSRSRPHTQLIYGHRIPTAPARQHSKTVFAMPDRVASSKCSFTQSEQLRRGGRGVPPSCVTRTTRIEVDSARTVTTRSLPSQADSESMSG